MRNPLPLFLVLVIVSVISGGCTNDSPRKTSSSAHVAVKSEWEWLEADNQVEGMTIALGHRHRETSGSGWLEPAAAITKNGTSVADAMVFTAFISADGQVIRDELATVFEPSSDDAPAVYTPGKQRVPESRTSLAVRYRIILPGVAEEWTRDVTIKVGDAIKIFGWRSRDGTPFAHLREVTLADGQRLFFGPPAGTGEGAATAR